MLLYNIDTLPRLVHLAEKVDSIECSIERDEVANDFIPHQLPLALVPFFHNLFKYAPCRERENEKKKSHETQALELNMHVGKLKGEK